MSTAQSDTPRVNAMLQVEHDEHGEPFKFVALDDARQLERELVEMERDRNRAIYDGAVVAAELASQRERIATLTDERDKLREALQKIERAMSLRVRDVSDGRGNSLVEIARAALRSD